ncbi:MAG: ABC transporter ATP-binding protein [Candidatus Dormibacter sp.]|uniref:ABC transporter ATP-binding protein n=1 Tax=Candidatus Dormibacter sp. TaxID=2973982 RepID=UPI000DB0E237|nr:MAG: dipeptide/oligopeptide/nickel ABC transporter ATP-binding protein [Candidatus Dormibacteraeota bacterium]
MTDVVLDVRNYSVQLHTATSSLTVVDDVSWSVGRGETLAIVGESGSGKTVSLMALLGLIPEYVVTDTAGSAHLGARDLLSLPESELRKVRGAEVGVIFQDPLAAFNPARRVGPQIAESARRHLHLSADQAKRRTLEVMADVSLPNPRHHYVAYPHELSGGMRQRALIAMAIVSGPSLVIADEPTSALDVTTQAQLLELLKRLGRDLNMGLVLVSHDMGVVAALADQVAVMYAGRIAEYGSATSVLKCPDHPYTRGLLDSIPDPRLPHGTAFRALSGAPPDLASAGVGCRFADRCELAVERCVGQRPALEPVPLAGGQSGERQLSACWRHPRVTTPVSSAVAR